MIRKYTKKLLDLNDQGILDKDELILSLLIWMSEDDVKKFYKTYDYDSLDDLEDCDTFINY